MSDGRQRYLARFRGKKAGIAGVDEFSALLVIDSLVVQENEYLAVRLQAEKVARQEQHRNAEPWLVRVWCFRVEKLQPNGRTWLSIRFPVPLPMPSASIAPEYTPSSTPIPQTWPE